MIEDKIEKLKVEYKSIAIPNYLVSNGWLDLSLKLPQKGKSVWHIFFVRGLIFASIVFFLSVGVIGASQTSKPGDILFPVKVLSEKVAIKAGVNPEISVVRRANDLIDQSKKDSVAADKASVEYSKTLEQGKQDAEKNGNIQKFKRTLDAQERKFTEAQKEDKDSQELKKAAEDTAKIQGEVKGEKDFNKNNNQIRGNSSDHNKNGDGHGFGNYHNGDHGRDN